MIGSMVRRRAVNVTVNVNVDAAAGWRRGSPPCCGAVASDVQRRRFRSSTSGRQRRSSSRISTDSSTIGLSIAVHSTSTGGPVAPY